MPAPSLPLPAGPRLIRTRFGRGCGSWPSSTAEPPFSSGLSTASQPRQPAAAAAQQQTRAAAKQPRRRRQQAAATAAPRRRRPPRRQRRRPRCRPRRRRRQLRGGRCCTMLEGWLSMCGTSTETKQPSTHPSASPSRQAARWECCFVFPAPWLGVRGHGWSAQQTAAACAAAARAHAAMLPTACLGRARGQRGIVSPRVLRCRALSMLVLALPPAPPARWTATRLRLRCSGAATPSGATLLACLRAPTSALRLRCRLCSSRASPRSLP